MKIKCNEFVKRQVKESPFSHFEVEGGEVWESLEALTSDYFSNPRYSSDVPERPGVKKVRVPANASGRGWTGRFYSGVCQLTPDTELEASMFRRREGEDYHVRVLAHGEKTPAKVVEIIVYSREALAHDANTDADHEIVSINARITEEEEPPTPMAMARNFLGLPGGSKAVYTADDFARAIVYWSDKAMVKGT